MAMMGLSRLVGSILKLSRSFDVRKRPKMAVLTVDYVNEANSEMGARFQGRSSAMRLTG